MFHNVAEYDPVKVEIRSTIQKQCTAYGQDLT